MCVYIYFEKGLKIEKVGLTQNLGATFMGTRNNILCTSTIMENSDIVWPNDFQK